MKALWLALFLTGCGTQFTDPIRQASGGEGGEAGSSPATDPNICSREPVQELMGTNFATMMRLVQDDFTIELWIKTSTSLTGAGPYLGNPLVYADVPKVTTDDFGAGILNDKFQLTIGNPDTPVKSTSNVTTDRWVHVAASRTRASGLVLVFVDGVLEGVGTGNTNSLSASPTMSVGGRADRDFFVGLMTDLRIWSTVRSQAEIQENMHRRLEGNETGLVGYYRMDDDAGPTLRDSSPSQNSATLASPADPASSDPPVCGQ
jgi:Concanavalin A-like lectin/glucanases superfamily